MANEWLDNLKVGDKVIISGGFGDDSEATVKRFTPTLIIIDSGRRYRRKNGDAVSKLGGGWSRLFLVRPTQERLDAIQLRLWVARLRHHKWQDESLETLSKIVAILTDGKAEPGSERN